MTNGSRNRPGLPRPSRPAAPTLALAVAGGGPVGLAAAIALALQGHAVTHVARIQPPVDDGRTVALLAASWTFLDQIGLDRATLADVAPLATMHMVDATGSLFRTPPVEFRAAEVGLDAFGWNIPLAGLIEVLERLAADQPNLTRLDANVTTAQCDAASVRLRLDTGTELVVPLAIAADGRKSLLREAAGIACRDWTYPQTALTARLAHTRPHRDISTEFHTREGPCTLVPMRGNQSALVWMMRPERAEAMRQLPPDAFSRAVEDQTQSIVGQMRLLGERGAIPMAGLSVAALAANRVALVGEAAHLFPPIGAQGLNMGLRDVRALVEAMSGQSDDSVPTALDHYAAKRRMDVAGRSAVVDLANRSLLAPYLPVDLLRGLGLASLAHIGPLRRLVMRGGLAGGVAGTTGTVS